MKTCNLVTFAAEKIKLTYLLTDWVLRHVHVTHTTLRLQDLDSHTSWLEKIGFLPCTVPTTYLAHELARLRVQRRGSESYWPVRRLLHRPQTKTGPVRSRRQTSKSCTGKPDPSNLYQDKGWWPALAGAETCQWSTTHHLGPPDLSWHGCYSDWGPAASGGQTVLANDRNGRRLRLSASRHYYYWECCYLSGDVEV